MNNIKNIILISSLVMMSGCATMDKPELPPSTVVRNQLVFVTLPDDFFTIPDNIPSIDVSTATQKEVASWITSNEQRTQMLENKMLQLKNYFISTYDLLKTNAGDNVIVVDTTKSDTDNAQTIKDAVEKPVTVPPISGVPFGKTSHTPSKNL